MDYLTPQSEAQVRRENRLTAPLRKITEAEADAEDQLLHSSFERLWRMEDGPQRRELGNALLELFWTNRRMLTLPADIPPDTPNTDTGELFDSPAKSRQNGTTRNHA